MVLKKLTLVILSALLYISLFIAIFGSSIQILLFPEIYETALEKNNMYDYIEEQIADKGYIPDTIFVKKAVKSNINKILSNALSYIRGDVDNLELTINLNDTLQSFFEERASELPICMDNQDPLDDLCLPEDIEPSEYLDYIFEQENIDASEFTSINLGDVVDLSALEQVREAVSLFRKVLLASIILSIVLIIMIILLNRKSVVAITEWIDADLFAVSFCMFAISYFIRKFITRIIPPGFSLFEGLLTSLIFAILDLMMYYGGALALIGIILIVFTVVYKFLNKKK